MSSSIKFQTCLKAVLFGTVLSGAVLSCNQDNELSNSTPPDFAETQQLDIPYFSTSEAFHAKIDELAQINPYDQERSISNDGFESAWDLFYRAEREAMKLTESEVDAFVNKWDGKIRITEDGSLEPLYTMYYKNMLVGVDGLCKVGEEYVKVFDNGTLKSKNREALEAYTGSTFQSSIAEGGELEFFPSQTIKQSIGQGKRADDFNSTCEVTKKVSGQNRRIQGDLNGEIESFSSVQTRLYLQSITKNQKKVGFVWVNYDADLIIANGTLQYKWQGTLYTTHNVAETQYSQSTVFVSQTTIAPGYHYDFTFGTGSGFHKIDRSGFTLQCSTSK